jgi:hypothetical protein
MDRSAKKLKLKRSRKPKIDMMIMGTHLQYLTGNPLFLAEDALALEPNSKADDSFVFVLCRTCVTAF